MRKYKIEIMPSARDDLRENYFWGCKKWGVKQAKQWVKEAKKAVYSLTSFPQRHPLAPESEEFNIEIRQMIFQRYRILFLVGDDTVHVLHLREAYKGNVREEEEEN